MDAILTDESTHLITGCTRVLSKCFVRLILFGCAQQWHCECVALQVHYISASSGVGNPAPVKYIPIFLCANPCSLDTDAQCWHIGTLHVTYFELRVACCALHMCACALDNDGQYWHKKIIWGQGDGGAGARPRPLGVPTHSVTQ